EVAARIARQFGPPLSPGDVGQLGGYRVLKLLGQGGMGVVFLAEDVNLRRHVAIKCVRPDAPGEAAQRFLREARIMANVQHEHVVTIYQVGEDRGVPFLAMELLEGEALDARLDREGRLPVAEAVRLA